MRSGSSFQKKRDPYFHYFLLLVICLVAYWPIALGFFSVKNDAIHYFLPYRFQISETLRNGELPFWNPYIYQGYPIYGDMQSGAWNPVVWFFSLFGRYNITLFHFENLLYIFIAAIGMFKLAKWFSKDAGVSFLISVAYMLCGFMLSGQLINWLAAAAFIPFAIYYYLRLFQGMKWNYAIKTGIALFFLFTAGYPSFFILTCYLLISLFVYKLWGYLKEKKKIVWKKWLGYHLLIIIVFGGLSIPAIVSYYELLPYYQRGSGTSYDASTVNSFEAKHLITFLFPSPLLVPGLYTETDLTCRNVYIGLFAVLTLFVFPPKLTRRNITLIIFSLIAFLYSLGDATPVHKIVYSILPLMDTFRHPSQARLFLIMGILLLTIPGVKRLLSSELSHPEKKKFKITTIVSLFIFFIAFLITIFDSEIFPQIKDFLMPDTGSDLKNILSMITPNDAIALNALIQLGFTGLLLWSLNKQKRREWFAILWVLNLAVMAQLVLPSTFVGKTSPKEINTYIRNSPKSFPAPSLDSSLFDNSENSLSMFDKIGPLGFYNKKPGLTKITNTPAFLAQQEEFLNNGFLYNYVGQRPFAYLADQELNLRDSFLIDEGRDCDFVFTDNGTPMIDTCIDSHPEIRSFSANKLSFNTVTTGSAILSVAQNHHHYWKVWVDGASVQVLKVNLSFIGVQVPAGKHEVVFKFIPSNTLRVIWLPVITIVLIFIFFLMNHYSSKKHSKRSV